MNIEREPVYFRPLVQEIYAMFQHKIKEKGLDIFLEIDDTIPEVFEFDETRVRQIMINLLGNAVKFTEKGFIKVKVTVFNRTKERFDIRISVIDSGRGIEKEEQKKIFHSFQQNKNQKYNEYGGTGLGLAITEKLVKMMNGEITLESELGKGSTFSVTFYNITITQGIIQKQDKFFNVRKIHFPGKNILIVEDVASNRLILTRLLKNLNINVIQAENGEEALILLENITPDLILMDIRMPVMDGLEATKIIRKNKKIDTIPIIAVTASAEQYSQKNLRETFDDIILKPISKSVIVEVISKYLKYQEIPGENEKDVGDLTSQCNIADIVSDKLLLRELQEKFTHKIPSLLNQMLINDITVFADNLEELAKEYDNECLKQFANKLLEDAENFDIPEVEAGLKQFYEKISNS
jgi:two-component system sensor histidine kinase EvgS